MKFKYFELIFSKLEHQARLDQVFVYVIAQIILPQEIPQEIFSLNWTTFYLEPFLS